MKIKVNNKAEVMVTVEVIQAFHGAIYLKWAFDKLIRLDRERAEEVKAYIPDLNRETFSK